VKAFKALVPLAALIVAGCAGGGGSNNVIPSGGANGGGGYAAPAGSTTSNATTAQGVTAQLDQGSDVYVFTTEGGDYVFNTDEANANYTNAFFSGPTVTCSNGSVSNKGTKTDYCDAAHIAANSPVAPTTPDATDIGWGNNSWFINADGSTQSNGSPGSIHALLNGAHCIFWNGGTLPTVGYQQMGTASGVTAGRFTYTWTYHVTPNGPVAPHTAWDLPNASGDPSIVTIPGLSGFIAEEEAQHTANNNRTKVNFSLGGLQGGPSPSITGFAVSVKDGGGNLLYTWNPIPTIDDTDNNWTFSSLAGSNITGTKNSDTGLLFDNANIADIIGGHAADGDGYYVNFMPGVVPERAVFSVAPFTLTVAPNTTQTFTVTFTGHVGGITIDGSGGGASAFSVTNVVHISAPSC